MLKIKTYIFLVKILIDVKNVKYIVLFMGVPEPCFVINKDMKVFF